MKISKFSSLLMKNEKRLGHPKPREVVIFNVHGNYGDYQIKVGPEDRRHRRSVEINGKIHHLFITKQHVAPLPTHDEVKKNMRGTIIMNEVTVHLFDEKGDGHAVKIEREDFDGAHARENINLAGKLGEETLYKFEKTGRLANETYHIVQDDILKSLK